MKKEYQMRMKKAVHDGSSTNPHEKSETTAWDVLLLLAMSLPQTRPFSGRWVLCFWLLTSGSWLLTATWPFSDLLV